MKTSLKSISVSNIKDCTFEHQLAPITFFIGGNYKGKTARLDAIRLFLAGYLPWRGKLPGKTFDLSSGREMSVEGVISGGGRDQTGRRVWKVKDDGVNLSSSVPEILADKEKFIVMIHADEWFGKTEQGRIEWVAKNVAAAEGATEEKVLGEIRAVLSSEEADFDVPLLDKFFENLAEAAEGIKDKLKDGETIGAIELFLPAAESVEKKAKDHAKTMQETVAGLTKLRAAEDVPPDKAPIEARIAKSKGEIELSRSKKAEINAAIKAQEKNAARRKALQDAITGRPEAVDKANAAQKAVEASRSAHEILPKGDDDLSEIKKEQKDLIAANGGLKSVITEAEGRIAGFSKRLDEIEKATSCPYCGATGTDWKEIKRKELFDSLRADQEKVLTTRASYDGNRLRIEAISNKTSGVERLAKAHAESISALQAKIEAAYSAREASNGFSKAESDIAAIPADDPTLDGQLKDASSRLAELETELFAASEELKAVEARKGEAQRLAQAEKQRDDAKKDQAIASRAVSAIKDVRAKVVEQALLPVVEQANRIFGEALRRPLAYNASRSEIGSWDKGRWISHSTFSGVEQMMTYAAIQAALSSRAPIRIMLLDEMLRAKDTKDQPAFTDLVNACKEAVRRGDLDNFVGVVPGDPEDYSLLAKPEETDVKIIPIQ